MISLVIPMYNEIKVFILSRNFGKGADLSAVADIVAMKRRDRGGESWAKKLGSYFYHRHDYLFRGCVSTLYRRIR
ncbi:MAG: hypothetical protein ACI9EP_001441 [Oceanospirillaceae bacterium]|jgi:hypothetical protein